MDNQLSEQDTSRTFAGERSHEEARQSVITNRMLVQSLIFLNGLAAITAIACHRAPVSGPVRLALPATIILYCLGVFTAVFAGLYIRRTCQEWSSYWEQGIDRDKADRERAAERHRRQAIKGKRWSTGLLVSSELFFLAASLSLAMSLE
jgi:hypothetical protein